MKKQLLFVMNSLVCGGAERSLISLLRTIDYAKHDVDLFLFKHEGMLLDQLPLQVNVLPSVKEYGYFDMPIKTAIRNCLAERRIGLAMSRARAGLIFRSRENAAVREQRAWKFVARSFPRMEKQYDAAIGYLEKNPIYYVVEKVKAARKIGFIHSDYNQLGMMPELDRRYFDQLDYLVTVSEQCGQVLRQIFPEYRSKVKVIHNIVSPALLRSMAREEPDWEPAREFRIVSVGRLHPAKGYDMAIEACRQLVQNGYPVKWFVVGEGDERPRLEALIRQCRLEDRFILLGLKENPYPYLRGADVYVHPSRFEGKSIAIDEAKILGKPIVATDFSTVYDQITPGVNGIVVEKTPEAIADGIRKLLDHERLRARFASNLAGENLGTENEIHKLYQLV